MSTAPDNPAPASIPPVAEPGTPNPTPVAETAIREGPAPNATAGPITTTEAPRLAATRRTSPFLERAAVVVNQFDWLNLALLALLTFLLGSFLATNSDLWMQLATGRLLAQGDYTFGVDPFAVTTEKGDVTWVNHSWLTALLLYGLYDGDMGLALGVLRALIALAILAILFAMRRRGASAWVGTLCLLAAMLALSSRLLLNPMLISYLLLAASLFVLHGAGVLRTEGQTRPAWLWLMPVLCALWVNLDSWFILGPIMLLAAAVGAFLEQRSTNRNLIEPALLARVLGVSLLACLVNPHHIWAFQLPSELAYMWVSIVNIGPDWLVGGGRTLLELRRSDPSVGLILSPLSAVYWKNPTFGLNAAGIAFFLLVFVGAWSWLFLWRTRQVLERARVFWPRFLIWLFFLVAALWQFRLLGLFAVVGGLFTMQNLQDYLSWRESSQPQTLVERWKWARAGMAGSLLLFVGLLFLAWPGWLNAPVGDFRSPRRVAWGVLPDSSLRRTALFLHELHQSGAERGFNWSDDLANYCAWYAPDVKHFIDHRYPLFVSATKSFRDAQDSLRETARYYLNLGRLPQDERFQRWQNVFGRHGIDHVTISRKGHKNDADLLINFSWWQDRNLVVLHDDGQTAVLRWGGARDVKPAVPLTEQWRQWAFVEPPASLPRAEAGQSIMPPESPGFWALYWQGEDRLTAGAKESQMYLDYFFAPAQARGWRFRYIDALHVAGTTRTAALRLGPWGVVDPLLYLQIRFVQQEGKGNPEAFFQMLGFLNAQNVGAAAAPILAVRESRQALLDNPREPLSYFSHATACRALGQFQENAWAPAARSGNLRATLREVQFLAGIQQGLLLQPENSEAHWTLAEAFLTRYFLDLALEEMRLSLLYLEVNPPANVQNLSEVKNLRRQRYKDLEQQLEKRAKDFTTRAGNVPDVARFRVAFLEPYKFLAPGGKEFVDPQGMGLAAVGEMVLDKLMRNERAFKSLTPSEQGFVIYWRLQLLVSTGRVWQAATLLPPGGDDGRYDDFRLLIAGATGDYVEADRVLRNMEKLFETGLHKTENILKLNMPLTFLSACANFATLQGGPYLPALADPIFYHHVLQGQATLATLKADRAQRTLLRGLVALEAGDPDPARALLQKAVDAVPPRYLPDRPIAERYLKFLRQP